MIESDRKLQIIALQQRIQAANGQIRVMMDRRTQLEIELMALKAGGVELNTDENWAGEGFSG